MFEKSDYIKQLIGKHFRNELTPEEQKEFDEWLAASEANRNFLHSISDDNLMEEEIKHFLSPDISNAFTRFQQRIHTAAPTAIKHTPLWKKKYWKLLAAAVSLLFLTAITLYVVIKNKKTNYPDITTNNIKPKHFFSSPIKNAEITLLNGSKISFEQMTDDSLIEQGAYTLFKHKNDLHYQKDKSIPFNEDLLNIVTTPPGSQVRIFLPDSSVITMNVASSINFNVSVPIRKVYLSGEAEFKIKHNAETPFLAIVPAEINHGVEGKIEVTGTCFNINAYEDEKVKKVSLLEGHINVSAKGPQTASTMPLNRKAQKLFKYGQQAQLLENGSINIIQQVDIGAVVSWKEGKVYFQNTPTLQALNTLERWYNLKVINKNTKMPDCLFDGSLTPNSNIPSVLDVMQRQCHSFRCAFDSIAGTLVMQ